jgi:hypothetical protein
MPWGLRDLLQPPSPWRAGRNGIERAGCPSQRATQNRRYLRQCLRGIAQGKIECLFDARRAARKADAEIAIADGAIQPGQFRLGLQRLDHRADRLPKRTPCSPSDHDWPVIGCTPAIETAEATWTALTGAVGAPCRSGVGLSKRWMRKGQGA